MKTENIYKKWNSFWWQSTGEAAKTDAENAERLQRERKQRIEDSRERIPIEGKFGQGKNGYRLNYIRAKLQKTPEAWINCIFLVMNLMVLLRELYGKLEISHQRGLFYVLQRFILCLQDFWVTMCCPAQVNTRAE